MSQRRWIAIGSMAAAILLVTSLTPVRAQAPELYTVADLTLRLAETLQLVEWDERPSAEEARTALLESGIEIAGDLERPLRERDAAAILGQTGMNLTTSNPDRELDGESVDRIFGLMFETDAQMARMVTSDSEKLRDKIIRFCRAHPGHRLCRILASHFQP